MVFLSDAPAQSTPEDTSSAAREREAFPRMSPSDVRQTGIRLKLRLLGTLVSLAIFLAVGLVALLGDPFGTEHQATLGKVALFQAQIQAQALNQALAERQQQISVLARTPDARVLQVALQSDPGMLACLVVNQAGLILTSGQGSQATPSLAQSPGIPDAPSLLVFVQDTLHQGSTGFAFGGNGHGPLLWLALAAPVAPDRVVLTLFSLSRIVQMVLASSNSLPGALGVVLDAHGRVVATVGTSVSAPSLLKPAPQALQAHALDTPSMVDPDPLTGRTDLVVGTALPALQGRYLLLVDAQTVWFPSTRDLVAGHNTPLLLLGIVVFVVLIATWFALPIIRPIRRTTRILEHTTQEVRALSSHAQAIASQHTLGVNLLIGTSQHLGRRRDAIVRDVRVLQQTVRGLAPHMHVIQHTAQASPHAPLADAADALGLALTQIGSTARSIEQGFTNDRALSSLAEAMEGAREISQQFEAAGVQLSQETRHLETATTTLL